MATTLFSPISTLSKSSFLPGPLPFSPSSFSRHGSPTFSLRYFKSPRAQNSSFDHIPKQFREENLKEGLKDNFKNVPQSLYGLPPSQMDMFMREDNPVRRQSEKVTEQSISSASSYLKMSQSVSLDRDGDRRPRRRRRNPPPDLPSLIFDARIVYLGLPIVPAVTELIVAELIYLDYMSQIEPIYLYINCSGTQNLNRESVGLETEAYAIADAINFCTADVYTVNLAMALGQAAMLLSLGTKGFRALQPNSFTKLYLPEVYRSSGAVSDMYIKGKELKANTDYFIELLARGTGKSKEELAHDLRRPKFFDASEAIEYGLADRIIDPYDPLYRKRNN